MNRIAHTLALLAVIPAIAIAETKETEKECEKDNSCSNNGAIVLEQEVITGRRDVGGGAQWWWEILDAALAEFEPTCMPDGQATEKWTLMNAGFCASDIDSKMENHWFARLIFATGIVSVQARCNARIAEAVANGDVPACR